MEFEHLKFVRCSLTNLSLVHQTVPLFRDIKYLSQRDPLVQTISRKKVYNTVHSTDLSFPGSLTTCRSPPTWRRSVYFLNAQVAFLSIPSIGFESGLGSISSKKNFFNDSDFRRKTKKGGLWQNQFFSTPAKTNLFNWLLPHPFIKIPDGDE